MADGEGSPDGEVAMAQADATCEVTAFEVGTRSAESMILLPGGTAPRRWRPWLEGSL